MTLLLFWNYPSEACLKILPELQRLYRKTDRRKLDIISVFSKQPEKALRFLKWKKIKIPCGYDQEEVAFESYRVKEIPVFYVIDDECNLIDRWIGYDEDTLQEMKKFLWKFRKQAKD